MCKKTCSSGLLSGFEGAENALGHYAVSLAGHDAGKIYLVVGVSEDRSGKRMLLLADGKSRPVAGPKAKKAMHVAVLKAADPSVAAKLVSGAAVDDPAVARSIKEFRAARNNDHCEKEA